MSLLRLVALVSAVTGLLVFASTIVGQMRDTPIVVGKLEFEGQVYSVYLEDPVSKIHVTLAGTRCFEALPAWVYPDTEADTVRPPISEPGRFFAEIVDDVMEVLTRCRPS